MKITVDGARCVGHGRCYTVAPALLSYDDDGYVTVRGQLLDVPPDQVAPAREAVASCPERAIAVVDD